MSRPDLPPSRLGPLLVVAAAVAVAAGVVGISSAVGQQSPPSGPQGAQPSEIAAASGDLIRPLPDALPGSLPTTSAVPTIAELPPVPTAAPRATPRPVPTTTPRPVVRTTAPKPAVTKAPAPAPKAPATTKPAATVWDTIAQCESGGDWAHPETNGYSGGLLFSDTAWAQYGGTAYAPIAAQATKAQQIAVAEAVHTERGDYSAWPGCGDGL